MKMRTAKMEIHRQLGSAAFCRGLLWWGQAHSYLICHRNRNRNRNRIQRQPLCQTTSPVAY